MSFYCLAGNEDSVAVKLPLLMAANYNFNSLSFDATSGLTSTFCSSSATILIGLKTVAKNVALHPPSKNMYKPCGRG